MKVYVLTLEPYHDNSTVLGVTETEAIAQAMADRHMLTRRTWRPGDWIDWDTNGNGFVTKHGYDSGREGRYGDDDYLITEYEVES